MKIRNIWSVRVLALILASFAMVSGCTRSLGPVAPPPVPKVTATFTIGYDTFTPTETRTVTSTFKIGRAHV